MEKIRLGISACLLGESVRYDGGHRLDRFLSDTWGQFIEYVTVCPEVECGLGVPREAMRLEGDPDAPRLVILRTMQDMTDCMMRWAERRVVELERQNFCGFIFKSNSPSCGMERVKIYRERGRPAKKGMGMFARILFERFPLLPVEEERRLYDPKVRENFIGRIFTLKRWREVLERKKSRGQVVDFHTRHKLLILSHSPRDYERMGRWVAKAGNVSLKDFYQEYQKLLIESLRLKATPGRHANVLRHAMGYFKKQLSSDERQELLAVIDRYRKGSIPWVVPVTLINHYVRAYDQPYLKQQVYLNPHPLELQLRNHV